MVDKENKRKREKYRNLRDSRTKRVFFGKIKSMKNIGNKL